MLDVLGRLSQHTGSGHTNLDATYISEWRQQAGILVFESAVGESLVAFRMCPDWELNLKPFGI